MPIPQLILFLDTSGIPHAEFPGRNGARPEKLDLGPDWPMRNPELMQALQNRAVEQRLEAEKIARFNAINEAAREAESKKYETPTNAEIAAKRMADWQAKFEAADPATQFKMAITASEARDKQAKLESERSKQLYQGLASKHDIPTANKVIPQNRRPNKRLSLKGGGSYNGRTEKQYDSKGKLIKPAGKTRRPNWEDADMALAVNVEI